MADERIDPEAKADVPERAYVRKDRVARLQRILPVVAVVIVGGFLIAGIGSRGEGRLSPAPLAEVHAMWDLKCSACHTTGTPISANNWLARATGHEKVADAQCQQC